MANEPPASGPSRIQRHFLGWDAPLLPGAAAFLAERYGGPGRPGEGEGPYRGEGDALSPGESGAPPPGESVAPSPGEGVAPSSEEGGEAQPGQDGGPPGGDPSDGRDALDLSKALVVVPGRRAGRRLTELLLERAEAEGRPLRPPRVGTAGALPDLLRFPPSPTAPAEDRAVRQVWAEGLRRTDPTHLRPLLRRPPAPGERLAWWSLAAELQGLRGMLLGEGLDFADVARRVEAGLPDDPERWSLLAGIADAVDRRLAEAGLTDRARARRDAAHGDGGSAEGREVFLVGLPELPRVLRWMLEGLDDPVHALVNAPESEADRFGPDGTVRVEAWTDRPLPVAAGHVLTGDRPSDQGEALLRALAETGGRWSADEVAVGIGDEEVRPHVERALAHRDVPARYAAGRPLPRTGPLRLLAAAAAYLDGHAAEDLARLLRHPDLGRWLERRDGAPPREAWLSRMDAYRAERLPASLPGPAGPAGVEPNPGLPTETAWLVDRIRAEDLLGPFEDARPLREWPPLVLELLLTVYGEEPLDRARPRDRELLEALRRMEQTLQAFHALPPDFDREPVPGPDALRILLHELEAEAVPPDPERRAVELLGWLELVPDDAPAVIVTGLNDGRIPESVQGDPWFPDALRSALGLPDNRSRYARDAFALTVLVRSRPFVRLVTGRRSATGDPLRPSRLLLATGEEELPGRILHFLEGEPEEAGGDGTTAPEGDPTTAREGAEEPLGGDFPLPPEPVIRAPEPLRSLRVTDFGLLLEDPYRFALERILELEAVDESARELDGLGFGRLLHRVLERFGRWDRRNSSRPEVIRDFVEGMLEEEARHRFGTAPLPAVRVQVELARVRLRAFAPAQAERARQGWTIERVEAGTDRDGDGAPFPVDGRPFGLRGVIDRIDRHPDGRWAVLDYKTGDGARDPEREHRAGRKGTRRWRSLQLPLYRHLLPAVEPSAAEGGPAAQAPSPGETPLPEETPPPEETPSPEETPPPGEAPRPEETPGDGPRPRRVELGFFLLPREAARAGVALADWDEDTLRSADEAAREVVRFVRENRFEHHDVGVDRLRDPFAELRGAGVLRPGGSLGNGGRREGSLRDGETGPTHRNGDRRPGDRGTRNDGDG